MKLSGEYTLSYASFNNQNNWERINFDGLGSSPDPFHGDPRDQPIWAVDRKSCGPN